MKRFLGIFFCIAAISWAVFYGVSIPHDPLARAAGGVIDLSGAGPEGSAYVLEGEWEFYWGHLYEPKDFVGKSPEKTFIPVPASWNKHGYPRHGYATYRLRLLTPPKASLMLYVPEILSASAVWVNGEKVFSAGRVGRGAENFQASAKSALISPPAANGVYEIVVQAAN